jgi:hypothetical protein
MKRNGSAYVAIVVALLVAYFSYQWWFNPRRAIKRQLGELAATLSVPAETPGDMDRLARVARLRNYFAPDVRVAFAQSGAALTSRDALLGLVAAWKPPPGGWTVSFVDVQIALESSSTSQAYLTVEIESADPNTGRPVFDAREARVNLAKQDGTWVITAVEPVPTLERP